MGLLIAIAVLSSPFVLASIFRIAKDVAELRSRVEKLETALSDTDKGGK